MSLVYQQREFLLLILQAFICGASLGVLYDVFRLFRMATGVSRFASKELRFAKAEFALIGELKSTKRKEGRASAVILFFCDLAFMIAAACAVLCVLFFRNDGRFRWVVLLFTGGGFFCYYVSIGYLVMRCGALIICLLRIAVAYLVFFITYPIKYLTKLIVGVVKRLAGDAICRARAIYIKKEAKKEYARLLSLADGGFLDDGRKAAHSLRADAYYKKKQDEKTKEDIRNVRIGKNPFGKRRKGAQKI